MFVRAGSFVSLLLLAALAPQASAAENCRAFGLANDYNAFVFGDFKAPSSDVEGRLAAGGRVDINNYSIADKLTAATAGTSVVVGGDFVFPSGRIYYGSAKVGGSAAGVGAPVRNGLAPGQTITDRTTLPFSFSSEQSRLTALSATIAALPANATYESKWGGLYLKGKAGASLQVFDLPGQLVLDAHTFDATGIPSGATVVFNIRGTTAGLTNMSLETLASIRRRVLFNFPDATRLELAGVSVEGAILAPKADINNPQGVIKGTLIAKSWNGMMQLNHEPFEGCVQSAPSNAAPTITSAPDTIATVNREYRYDVDATDADNDRLTYARTAGPNASIDASTGLLRWTPAQSDVGTKSFTVTAEDGRGGKATQSFNVRVVERFCPLYPIAVPHATVSALAAGAVVNQMPRGNGTGNFAWLSWTGANDAPTLANSLLPPGDSHTYTNPDSAADKVLDAGDWAQGGPGNMNSSSVRTNLDALKNRDIIVPTWTTARGQGSKFDYKVAGFATIRLRDYQINGQGWLTFEYRGMAQCYGGNAPVATAQGVTTNEDTPKAITLAGTDADGDALTYVVATQPAKGTLSGTAPNLTYTPNAHYAGADSFTFKVKDASSESAAATVSITVTPVNDAPVALAQSVTTNENVAKSITLAGTDADGDALTYIIATQPAKGSLTGSGATRTYTPNPGYHGPDSFTFKVKDGNVESAAATVSITVTPVNDRPVANAQSVTTSEDTPAAITLIGSDADGDPLTYHVATQPAHGMLSGSGANRTYVPDANYHGRDSLTFTVEDGSSESAAATVDITIAPLNDAPIATAQDVRTDRDVPKAITLAGTDADGDALTFELADRPQHGDVALDGATATYTPANGYAGTDSFTFVAKDANSTSAPATVGITVDAVNRAPVALPQQVATPQDTARTITLVATDADGDALTYRIATGPQHGRVELSGAVVTYTPAAGYTGEDSFAFTAKDGAEESAPATVDIHVESGNHAPVANDARYEAGRNDVAGLEMQATDADGDAMTYRIETQPAHGTIAIEGNIAWFTPETDFVGVDRFTFVAIDVHGAESAPATIEVEFLAPPPNQAPVAQPQRVDLARNQTVNIVLEASDPEGSNLTWRIVTPPQHGTAEMVDAQEARYTPATNYSGPDSFAFVVNDGELDSEPATVTLAVGPNHAPSAESFELTVDEDTALDLQPAGNDTDGDAVTFTAVQQPEHGTLTTNGNDWRYVPARDYAGSDRITYIANDGELDSPLAQITVQVRPVNDPPVAEPQALSTDRDTPLDMVLNARDVDSTSLTWFVDRRPGNGGLDGTAPNLTYHPAVGFAGDDSLTFRVVDDRGLASTATVTIHVRASNRAPVARDQDVSTDEADPVSFVLDASDADGDTLDYTLGTPQHGTLSGHAPALTYTPAAGFHGTDQFAYTVDDGALDAQAVVTITVADVDFAPTATAQSVNVVRDVAQAITLAGTDPDGDALTYAIATQPEHGTLTGTGADRIYTPAANYVGTDRFTFTVKDRAHESAPATVDIVVSGDNRAPVAIAQSLTTEEGDALAITLAGTDADGDALSYRVVAQPQHGMLSGTAPALTYTPAAGFDGTDRFTFVANDGKVDSSEATITIAVAPINDAPQITTTAPTTVAEGQSYRYDVDATDPDGDVLTYSGDRLPAGLGIDAHSGLLQGELDAALTQSVRAPNPMCYVVPENEAVDPDTGAYVPPLYREVQSAIERASRYVAPQSTAWHAQNKCYGCHVQAHAVTGLFGAMNKANVDAGAAEFLLQATLDIQQPSGSFQNAQTGPTENTQNAFALWSLSFVADRDRTRDARARSLRYLLGKLHNPNATVLWWDPFDPTGYTRGQSSVTAMISLAAARFIDEIGPASSAEHRQLEADLLHVAPAIVETTLTEGCSGSTNNPHYAFRLITMMELRRHMTDAAKIARIDARATCISALLRTRQNADGGWAYDQGGLSDPLASAWVGFALDYLDPAQNDAAIRRNIRFLLDTQRDDGTWASTARLLANPLLETRLTPTGLVMAYLPVALDHLGNPDVALGRLQLTRNGLEYRLSAEVLNRGLAPVAQPTTIRFFEGDDSARLLGETTLASLAPGATATVTISLGSEAPDANVHAIAQPHASVVECDSRNNTTSAAPASVRVRDPLGLWDAQTFLINQDDVNAAPTITSAPVTSFEQGRAYDYRVTVSDADIGDAHRYSLTTAPAGLFIDPISGRFHYDVDGFAAGTHTVTVRATDLRGAYAEQTFTLTTPANTPPRITSTPVTTTRLGEPYVYNVTATDADGDPITYRFDGAILTMELDRTTGVLTWTPDRRNGGAQQIAIVASDGRGGRDRQVFTLNVMGQNRAPYFTSNPPKTATAGQRYRYTPVAVDDDGDTVTFTLTRAPEGMTRDAGTGEIAWTPTRAQGGAHDVEITIDDGHGGTRTQAYVVTVTVPNTPPTITSSPLHTGKGGREYRYDVAAQDADGDALTYSLQAAPAGMTVDANGAVRWPPAAAGDYSATVRVADATSSVQQTWTMHIVAADVALATQVAVTPQPVQPGQPLTITVLTAGAAAPVTVTGTLDGQPLALDADGTTQITAPTVLGAHTIVVTVTDGYDTATDEVRFNVSDGSDTTPPSVSLITPADHPDHDAVEITAPTPVRGLVAGDDVASWLLAVRDPTTGHVKSLASGTDAFDERDIATFDPTLLMNGQYQLILQAEDTAGNSAQDIKLLRVTGDMKIGHFSITFEEVTIPVAGIPVTVNRTYDTRRAHESLDFGYGWTVDANSIRLHESRRIGAAWDLHRRTGGGVGIGDYCLLPNGDPIVTVTLPDGEVASFRAKAETECSVSQSLTDDVWIEFEPIDGTDYALRQVDYGQLEWDEDTGRLIDISDPDRPAVDPRNYVLTTPEGLVYEIDQFEGIEKISDPSTNTALTFDYDGVRHSSGVDIDFVRDAQGRITQLQLPDGETIDYTYTPAGDLEAVADQLAKVTSLTYEPRLPHYLRDIVDARNVRVQRNEYDDDGRLEATIDADGHRTEFEHRLDAREEFITDRNKNRRLLQYDAAGRVISDTLLALNATTLRTYDDDGNVLTETDPAGHTITFSYDTRGNVIEESNAANEKTKITYNARNKVLSVTDALGRVVTQNVYDTRTGALLVSTKNKLGHETEFRYEGGVGPFGTGRLATVIDPNGAETEYVYDTRGFKTAEVDPLDHETTFEYDPMGRVVEERTTRTRADGTRQELLTGYRYDGKGNLVETAYPDGSVSTTTYDPAGRPVEQCAIVGTERRCTTTQYDARGDIARITYPDGTSESKAYDPNGNLVRETDRAGRSTRYVFDAADRLIETILPDAGANDGDDTNNPRTRSSYDAAGRIVAVTDANHRTTTYAYDRAGRRTHVVLPATDSAPAAGVTTEYDTVGQRVAETDANGDRIEFRYDDAGRRVETVFEDDSSAKSEYDAGGRKTAEVDRTGLRTEYRYDLANRLLGVTVAAGTEEATTTSYAYDERGNRISQTDAELRVTRWEYDEMGREVARTLPNGERETKAYDRFGALVAHTDFNGTTTRYTHDDAGRVDTIDRPRDADVAFGYDANDNRTSIVDGRGTSTRRYDAQGRLTRSVDADGAWIEYTYDGAGNMESRISPSQSLVYTYDARNRLKSVLRTIDGGQTITTAYEYDQDGNRTAMVSDDGIRTEYGYDGLDRLRRVTKRTANGQLMIAVAYDMDANGVRTAAQESDEHGVVRTTAWTYDSLKRLTGEVIDHRDDSRDRTSGWTYDRVGNRLTQRVAAGAAPVSITSYRYDVNDRLRSETIDGVETRYTYDDNGNMLTKATNDTIVEYAYDDADRLVEVRSGVERIAYVYDADGLRVRQTVTSADGSPITTYYVQDSAHPHAQVVEQWVQHGTGERKLAATFAYVDSLIAQTRYSQNGVPTTSFVHSDGTGSTRWLTDATGAVTDAMSYDAFGTQVEATGTTEIEHRYRGEAFDDELGLYYLRARWFAPDNGRFTQQDTWQGDILDPSSLHKYVYGSANPILYTDPSGHSPLMELIQGVNLQSLGRTVGARQLRKTARKFIEQTIRDVGSARREIRKCFEGRKRKSCELEIPLLLVGGGTHPDMAEHIGDAQIGASVNRLWAGFLHTFHDRAHSSWYIGKEGCKPKDLSNALQKHATGVDCDEFPMNSMGLGGASNHPTFVSLRYVPSSQNRSIGAMWKLLATQSGMTGNKKKKALVVAWTEIPISVWIPN